MFNKLIKIIMIGLISVRVIISSLVGECNVCFVNNRIACLNETHFSTCFEGLPTPIITKCPGKRFCTDDVLICRSAEDGFTPSCYHNYCGDCSVTNGVFTCMDENTYGYCFGNTSPLPDTLRSCPSGFVCNFNSREVCVQEDTNQPSCIINTAATDPSITDTTEISTTTTESATESTSETKTVVSTRPDAVTEFTTVSTAQTITTQMPTTTKATTQMATEVTTTTETSTTTTELPTTEITTSTKLPTTQTTTTRETPITEIPTTESATQTTTTTATRRDPKTICTEIGQQGYFKSDDTTCREYVYCYSLSGQYLGWFYYCDGYFNAATRKCQKERPLGCLSYEY